MTLILQAFAYFKYQKLELDIDGRITLEWVLKKSYAMFFNRVPRHEGVLGSGFIAPLIL